MKTTAAIAGRHFSTIPVDEAHCGQSRDDLQAVDRVVEVLDGVLG